MIYTSFFASNAPAGKKISVANCPPRGWSGPVAPNLAPLVVVSGRVDGASYERLLHSRFASKYALLRELERIRGEVGTGACLCCFERSPRSCHRLILSKFIFDLSGIRVDEWQPHRKNAVQGNLL